MAHLQYSTSIQWRWSLSSARSSTQRHLQWWSLSSARSSTQHIYSGGDYRQQKGPQHSTFTVVAVTIVRKVSRSSKRSQFFIQQGAIWKRGRHMGGSAQTISGLGGQRGLPTKLGRQMEATILLQLRCKSEGRTVNLAVWYIYNSPGRKNHWTCSALTVSADSVRVLDREQHMSSGSSWIQQGLQRSTSQCGEHHRQYGPQHSISTVVVVIMVSKVFNAAHLQWAPSPHPCCLWVVEPRKKCPVETLLPTAQGQGWVTCGTTSGTMSKRCPVGWYNSQPQIAPQGLAVKLSSKRR